MWVTDNLIRDYSLLLAYMSLFLVLDFGVANETKAILYQRQILSARWIISAVLIGMVVLVGFLSVQHTLFPSTGVDICFPARPLPV